MSDSDVTLGVIIVSALLLVVMGTLLLRAAFAKHDGSANQNAKSSRKQSEGRGANILVSIFLSSIMFFFSFAFFYNASHADEGDSVFYTMMGVFALGIGAWFLSLGFRKKKTIDTSKIIDSDKSKEDPPA